MKKIFFLFLLSTMVNQVMQAQITWDFNSNVAAAGAPVNITGNIITQGNNNGGTTFRNNGLPASFGYTGASAAQNGNCSAKPGVLNITATGSTYVQTILTPATDFWLNITGIKWGNFSLANTGPSTLSVYASNDNFATSTLIATATVAYSTTTWTLVNPAVTAFTGITNTAVTVRIFASGGTGTTPAAGAANWRIDDLVITATAQTGSVGQIPKYTGPSTFGNSIITENSGNIGIGTTTPAQKLDVAGGIKFSGPLVAGVNGAGTAGQVLQSNGSVNPPSWVASAAGTVTAIGVTTANGVSGTSSGGATPNLTISLGAITPSSVTATGNISGSNISGINTGNNAPNSLYSGLVSNATHSGDATGATVLTLATVNSNVGTFTNPTFTVNAKGLITAASNGATPVITETDPVVKAINGLVKSNGTVISAAVPGTDFLLPTGSAAGLTSFPIFNQNTTGNAATATTATNLAGGVAGSIPYQTAVGFTSMSAAGTAGYVLTSSGAGAPIWTNPGTLSANSWSQSGNALAPASPSFLGTTTNNDLVFKVNNIESGRLNDANANTYFGVGAANNNTGNNTTAIGKMAAFANTGSSSTAVGEFAGYQNSGVLLTAIGDIAAFGNTGGYLTALGFSAGGNNSGIEVTAIGGSAGNGNTGDHLTATGTASGVGNTGANVTGTGYFAAAYNSGSYLAATGYQAAYQNSGQTLTATGSFAGYTNTGDYSTALGFKAGYANTNSNSTAIGAFATVTADNVISLGGISGINGAYANVNVGIGTTAPSEKLHIQNGKIRMVDGTQGAGKILTSDANGVASWANAPTPPTPGWGLLGNAGTNAAINFIGTTDLHDLVFKVNNVEGGRLSSSNGNAFFGGYAGSSSSGSNVTAIGYNAAVSSTGDAVTAIGIQAGYLNSGQSLTAIGNGAGSNNTKDFVTATGANAASYNTGYNVTATGHSAAANNTGRMVTATGNESGLNNTGDVLTAYGHVAGRSNSGVNVIAIGDFAGQYNTANELTAIGSHAGINNTGNVVTASGGYAAYGNTGAALTANGYQAGANNTGNNVTALGYNAAFQNANNNATAVGAFASVTIDNAMSLGSINGINGATADVKVGIGTTAPSEKLHIQNGKLRIVDGTQGAGKLLTSDANGVASWANAPAPPSSGWGLLGNAGTNPLNNFIGTTDANDLVFRVNNLVGGRLGATNNNTSFGVNAALSNTGTFTTAIGYNAASGNSNDYLTAIGIGAAEINTGTVVVGIGYGAANFNTGTSVSVVGDFSGGNNTGNNVTAVGTTSAFGNTGSLVTATGNQAAFLNTGNNIVADGSLAATNNVGNGVTAIGSFAGVENTGDNATALGFKAAYSNTYNNITAIGAFATVTADNAMSLGSINGVNGATADTKVGIGTTAPSEKLHIQNGTIRIVDGTQGSGKVLTSDANGVASWQPAAFAKTSVSADNGLTINGSNIGLGSALNQATAITNNGFGLTIKGSKAATTFSSDGNLFSSGKIAIGTTDLAQIGNYSLAVNGAAIFTKASVKLIGNWPDYVFEPTYKLTALSEVEKFITEHKHLPGVPSATETQKNGIDLGENQAILLKKVEELTLYTIEANKKIEQQQAQINLLLKQQQAILEVQQQKNK